MPALNNLNNEGPRPVADPVEESPRSDHEDDGNKDDQEAEEPMEHTLRDFFQANQVTDNDLSQTSGSDIRAEESAAAYFNRQASLLMLYFPLAYMFIFAFSMVRLLYDMIASKPNAGLTIASLWFVLSAGLVDALVYVSGHCLTFHDPAANRLSNVTAGFRRNRCSTSRPQKSASTPVTAARVAVW